MMSPSGLLQAEPDKFLLSGQGEANTPLISTSSIQLWSASRLIRLLISPSNQNRSFPDSPSAKQPLEQ